MYGKTLFRIKRLKFSFDKLQNSCCSIPNLALLRKDTNLSCYVQTLGGFFFLVVETMRENGEGKKGQLDFLTGIRAEVNTYESYAPFGPMGQRPEETQ